MLPLFLIKWHLLSVKQLSVSCSAWGQINISVTWGLWSKARDTLPSATSFAPAPLGLWQPLPAPLPLDAA